MMMDDLDGTPEEIGDFEMVGRGGPMQVACSLDAIVEPCHETGSIIASEMNEARPPTDRPCSVPEVALFQIQRCHVGSLVMHHGVILDEILNGDASMHVVETIEPDAMRIDHDHRSIDQ